MKENQTTWSLPGGGLDHGEEPMIGLKRELEEELGITTFTTIEPACSQTFYLEPKQAWLLWVVYAVQTPVHKFTLGEGVTEAKFISPCELKTSSDIFEKMVYSVSQIL